MHDLFKYIVLSAFSVKVLLMLFFLHDQHYRMSVEWHILLRRSCLPLVKSLYTDSYKGGTIIFLRANIFNRIINHIPVNKDKEKRLPQLYQTKYRKIPKTSPDAYICQRPFLRGLILEGLIYGGKFVFQNRLRYLTDGRTFTIFALFYFVFEGNFQVQALRGLIFGGAI